MGSAIKSRALVAVIVFMLILTGVGFAQMGIEVPSANSPVELFVSPISSEMNPVVYRIISEILEIETKNERNVEILVIMLLRILNNTDTKVSTRFADLVAMTTKGRHMICAYLYEDPAIARPVFGLIDWNTEICVPERGEVRLRLVFIMKAAEHGPFQESLKLYGLFRHDKLGGLYHCIAISTRSDQEVIQESVRPGVNDIYGTEADAPIIDFEISANLTRDAVDKLRFPPTAISSGGESIYLDYLLGELGMDGTLPYWIGIAKAIDEGHFDYYTAMLLLDHVKAYIDMFPSRLTRTSIWLPSQGIIMVPAEDHVYTASDVYGICTLLHEAAEAIVYVAQKCLNYGIYPSDTAPIPGTYSVILGSPPVGFEIDCIGIHVKAMRTRRGYRLEIIKKAPDGQHVDGNIIPLEYIRKAVEY